MNKTIKLSLAAAMVAGMVSNANAKVNLEDAIKDVTLKGYVSYTMEKYTDKDGKDDEAQHDIDVRVQVDSKINDHYSLTVRVDEKNDDDTDKNPNDSDSTDKDSSALNPEIDQAYVTYKDGGLKIKTGMQKVLAPRLHDSINGDGVNIAYKISDSMKISGGYFYTTEDTGTDEVTGLSLSGKADILKYGFTYASIIDSDENNNDGSVGDNGADIIDVMANVTVMDGLKISAAHTVKSLDKTGEKDQKLTKLVVSGDIDSFKYAAAYAMAGKDGAKVSLDNDGDASVNLVLDAVSTNSLKDANAIYAMIGTNITDEISAKVEMVTASSDTTTGSDVKDADELMLTITNKITKKFKIFAKYNDWNIKLQDGTVDEDRTRVTLGAKYSF